MRYKFLFIFFFFSQVCLYAQKAEVGILAGVSYYLGEINQTAIFKSAQPAFGIVYRYNFNQRYVLRIDGVYSTLTGNDANSSSLYQKERNHSFSTPIADIAVQCEFNFLPYDKNNNYLCYSPYVVGGIALLTAPNPSSAVQLVIPFGVGFKYAITKKISIGIEWSYRLTFTDYLDQLSDDTPSINNLLASKQRSNSFNSDWYSFAGIIFTYSLSYGHGHCPAYKKSKHEKD